MKLRSAALSDDVSGERLVIPKGLEQPANTTRAKPAVARRKRRIIVPPRFIIAHMHGLSTADDAFDPAVSRSVYGIRWHDCGFRCLRLRRMAQLGYFIGDCPIRDQHLDHRHRPSRTSPSDGPSRSRCSVPGHPEAGHPGIAFFDFDGTLVRGDSLLPFLSLIVGARRARLSLMRAVHGAIQLHAMKRQLGNDIRTSTKAILLRLTLTDVPVAEARARRPSGFPAGCAGTGRSWTR